MSSVLITGASGMLGRHLKDRFYDADVILGRAELDLTNIEKTKSWIKNKYYSTIIHAAAFTDLDYCENNKKRTMILHASIVDTLNNFCDRLIYISTVPVWEKEQYEENTYFESKRAGEERTAKRDTNVVVRTNIYGRGGIVGWAHKNLNKGRAINGYEDVWFNPVHVDQLSHFIKEITEEKTNKPVYTIAGDTMLNKYDFLKKIAETLELDSSLIAPIETKKQNLLLENPDKTYSLKQGMELIKYDYKN